MIPTIKQLNKHSASKNLLLLLRVLNTSDLSFTYMMFAPDTIRDIINIAQRVLKIETDANCHDLGDDYLREYNELVNVLIKDVTGKRRQRKL